MNSHWLGLGNGLPHKHCSEVNHATHSAGGTGPCQSLICSSLVLFAGIKQQMSTPTIGQCPVSHAEPTCRDTAATHAAAARTELMRLAAAAAAGERTAAVLRLREDGLRLGALGVHRGGPLGRPCATARSWEAAMPLRAPLQRTTCAGCSCVVHGNGPTFIVFMLLEAVKGDFAAACSV